MFCRKCGTAVADQGKFCSGCGSPSSPQQVQKKARGRKKWWFIAGGLVLLAVIVSHLPEAPTTPAQARQTAPAKSAVNLPRVSAQEVANDYKENAAAADQTYLGKQFVVTGTVASINSGIGDIPYITFSNARNMFEEPQAHFGETDGRIAQLRKGQQLSLACQGGSSILGTPTFDDCAFVE